MNRKALTLIELLVAVAIMAIISALMFGVASHAIHVARVSRTKATLNKINELLTERLATYENRRIEPHYDFTVSIEHSFAGVTRGQALADVRLLATREMIKYEMPDRWSEVLADPVVLNSPPAPVLNYRGRYRKLVGNIDIINKYQSAECLFLVVMNLTGDGEAYTLFNKDELDDVDGDGAREFVDGWGQPIAWMRWSANFETVGKTGPVDQYDKDVFDVYNRDVSNMPGPAGYTFPPHHTYAVNVPKIMAEQLLALRDNITAYHLKPLVYSVGPDGISDINVGTDNVSQGLNPYSTLTDFGATKDVDDNGDDNYSDNLYAGEQ